MIRPNGKLEAKPHTAVTGLTLMIGCLAWFSTARGEVPYPAALDDAAVAQDRLDDIGRRGLILGNGDLNAILWQRNGELCLRVTKNDIWDARMDTSEDPPLMTMDIRNRKWSGGTKMPPSYKRPYPQPRCAAVVTIAMAGGASRLDLHRAVATVGKTTIRALAGRNVFLIDSPAAVSLEEVKAAQLPAAKLGETDSVKWLHMAMPGDMDYKGMEYALAVAGKGNRKAVSLVTSFDTKGSVRDEAIRLARDTVEVAPVALVAEHEAQWEKFWSASGVQLGDRFFQNAWYRNLYYMRCFCRPGTTMPITLYAGLATDNTGWHGAPTLDYNIEQEFWPMFVCNQVELMEPYVRYLVNFAPRGRWLAKQTYGLDGLFYPVNIFGPEHLVSPESAKSKNARQICYVPWSYGLGLTGWALQNVWLRYQYQPDRDYLEWVYPLLRDAAEFYAGVLEQCRDGELGPSYNPEHGPFGTFNNPVDIAYFRYLFNAAIEAARILDRDARLSERWKSQLARVPQYETTPLNGEPIVANWKGATADSVKVHNVVVPTVPIFPAGVVTWFSSPEQKALFERTLRWVKHNENNSHIMANVARARLSMSEAYTMTREHFTKIQTPNGLFAAWPGHGYYLAESWAFSGLTGELLLQSVDDPSATGQTIIRVFPAWPKDQDAKFTNLRAQGGFLVSAEQKGGNVLRVEIVATAAGKLRIINPWTGKRVECEMKPGMKREMTNGSSLP